MKPIIEKVPSPLSYSYTTEYIEVPHFQSKWHYHEGQVELIQILEGTGTGFIGDGITYFSGGELAIIGSAVPHVWLNDKCYYSDDGRLTAKAIVIKFDENFLGEKLLSLPGFLRIRELVYNRSKRGMMISGNAKIRIAKLIREIVETASDYDRVLLLIQILNIIAASDEHKYVSSREYVKIAKTADMERLDKVIKYVKENFQDKIELDKVAQLANLSPSAFCKYFKKRTLKTFTRFLNEIRIGNACKLLTEKEVSVKQACYMSGFNYLSNFYKQFHAIHRISPLEYRERLFESNLNPGL